MKKLLDYLSRWCYLNQMVYIALSLKITEIDLFIVELKKFLKQALTNL
jgi:hypothetical protein